MTVSKEVQFILEAADNLPPLPETLTKVLRRSSDTDVSLKVIATLISHDAGLTARILKTANSAYYKPVEEIKSIEAATSRLGINTIRNILLTLSMLDAFPQIYSEYYNHIFHSSIYTALASERIADQVKPALKSDAFFTGLLLNVGKLLFLRYLEEKYIRVMRDAQKFGVDLSTAEQVHLGIDYLAAGAIIAKRWKLPHAIVLTLNYFNHRDLTKIEEIDESHHSLIHITQCAQSASEFYMGWNKFHRYGLYQYDMQHFFSINKADAIVLLKELPEQFFEISATLGIKIPKKVDFETTLDWALQELPSLRLKAQKTYSDSISPA